MNTTMRSPVKDGKNSSKLAVDKKLVILDKYEVEFSDTKSMYGDKLINMNIFVPREKIRGMKIVENPTLPVTDRIKVMVFTLDRVTEMFGDITKNKNVITAFVRIFDEFFSSVNSIHLNNVNMLSMNESDPEILRMVMESKNAPYGHRFLYLHRLDELTKRNFSKIVEFLTVHNSLPDSYSMSIVQNFGKPNFVYNAQKYNDAFWKIVENKSDITLAITYFNLYKMAIINDPNLKYKDAKNIVLHNSDTYTNIKNLDQEASGIYKFFVTMGNVFKDDKIFANNNITTMINVIHLSTLKRPHISTSNNVMIDYFIERLKKKNIEEQYDVSPVRDYFDGLFFNGENEAYEKIYLKKDEFNNFMNGLFQRTQKTKSYADSQKLLKITSLSIINQYIFCFLYEHNMHENLLEVLEYFDSSQNIFLLSNDGILEALQQYVDNDGEIPFHLLMELLTVDDGE